MAGRGLGRVRPVRPRGGECLRLILLIRIERVDLEGEGMNTAMTLSVQDVLNATDGNDTLTIVGDAGDSLDAGSGWTDMGTDGNGNQIYGQSVGATWATLVVDTDIAVNADIML